MGIIFLRYPLFTIAEGMKCFSNLLFTFSPSLINNRLIYIIFQLFKIHQLYCCSTLSGRWTFSIIRYSKEKHFSENRCSRPEASLWGIPTLSGTLERAYLNYWTGLTKPQVASQEGISSIPLVSQSDTYIVSKLGGVIIVALFLYFSLAGRILRRKYNFLHP